jgi:RNA polymerase sigma factor (sigma-70 family)
MRSQQVRRHAAVHVRRREACGAGRPIGGAAGAGTGRGWLRNASIVSRRRPKGWSFGRSSISLARGRTVGRQGADKESSPGGDTYVEPMENTGAANVPDPVHPIAINLGPPSDADTFYRKHFSAVVKYLVLSGASLQEAEDATQDAMIKILRCWETILEPAAWVRRVARNAFLDAARRNSKAFPKSSLESGHWGAGVPGQPGPEECDTDTIRVTELIKALPDKQRVVFALVVDGLSPQEIAELLGQHAPTIRSNFRHAREKVIRDLPPDLRAEGERRTRKKGDRDGQR